MAAPQNKAIATCAVTGGIHTPTVSPDLPITADQIAQEAIALPFEQALRYLPGTGLATLIALAATSVSTLHGGPQLLYALLFGVAFHYLSEEPRTRPGIEFCSRAILRLGVGLLGARITAAQIAGLGWETALTVIAALVTTMFFGLVVGRRLGLTRAQRVLSGGAVAICGASAALAISAVLPREKNGDRFTLMVVVTVTVMSTLAGYMLDHETGDIATIVKLFRVSLLTVVVVIVAAAFRKSRGRTTSGSPPEDAHQKIPAKQPLVPWFLWLFIGMVMLNSARVLPAPVLNGINDVSRGCLVAAIAALGMKTSFSQLARAGWRPLALIAIETLWIAGFVLGVILVRR
jgi:uncharacterized membrane protein YadS